jgi:UDP-N-acetylmuramate dehydrogenase
MLSANISGVVPVLPAFITTNVPLANKTWFGTGGTAAFYCEPDDALTFALALQWAQSEKVPVFVLGEGANILISDEGFAGLVLKPALKTITAVQEDDTSAQIRAGSGVSFPDLIIWCLDHGYGGLEEFSGIPGTVGGSVFINIHYFQFLLSHFLVNGTVIDRTTGHILTADNAWFEFGYDTSRLHDHRYFLVDATFTLKKITPEAAVSVSRNVW